MPDSELVSGVVLQKLSQNRRSVTMDLVMQQRGKFGFGVYQRGDSGY